MIRIESYDMTADDAREYIRKHLVTMRYEGRKLIRVDSLYMRWMSWLIDNKKVRYYHQGYNADDKLVYRWVDNEP